jgi:two-component sensor histidine kinase
MSIRAKIILISTGFILFFGLTTIILIQTILTWRISGELQKRGVSMTRHFAEMATTPLLTEDMIALRFFASEYMAAEEDIEYVLVTDSRGEIVTHTFGPAFPVELKDANPIRPGQSYNIQRIITEEGDILDIAVPILNGEAGFVRLGISEEPIREAVARIILLMVWIIIVVLLLGIVSSYFLTTSITRPILDLEKAATAIGDGDLGHRIQMRTNDEVGHLSLTFNRMAENVQRTNERIEKSLKEKELLLREVHHRVKNNLVIISSLINLQSQRVEDPGYRELFAKVVNRIRVMSVIHDKLYRSEELLNLGFSDYIRSLSDQLLLSSTESSRIGLEMEIPETSFDIDTMIPLGLVVNELLSNAIKYAFPEGGEGTLFVGLDDLGGGRYRLVIRDDGVGLPEGFDIYGKETFGMPLVNSLVRQLGGEMEVLGERGAEFRITFMRSGTGA